MQGSQPDRIHHHPDRSARSAGQPAGSMDGGRGQSGPGQPGRRGPKPAPDDGRFRATWKFGRQAQPAERRMRGNPQAPPKARPAESDPGRPGDRTAGKTGRRPVRRLTENHQPEPEDSRSGATCQRVIGDTERPASKPVSRHRRKGVSRGQPRPPSPAKPDDAANRIGGDARGQGTGRPGLGWTASLRDAGIRGNSKTGPPAQPMD